MAEKKKMTKKSRGKNKMYDRNRKRKCKETERKHKGQTKNIN